MYLQSGTSACAAKLTPEEVNSGKRHISPVNSPFLLGWWMGVRPVKVNWFILLASCVVLSLSHTRTRTLRSYCHSLYETAAVFLSLCQGCWLSFPSCLLWRDCCYFKLALLWSLIIALGWFETPSWTGKFKVPDFQSVLQTKQPDSCFHVCCLVDAVPLKRWCLATNLRLSTTSWVTATGSAPKIQWARQGNQLKELLTWLCASHDSVSGFVPSLKDPGLRVQCGPLLQMRLKQWGTSWISPTLTK